MTSSPGGLLRWTDTAGMPYVAATRDAAAHVARQALRPYRKWTAISVLMDAIAVALGVARLRNPDTAWLGGVFVASLVAAGVVALVWQSKLSGYRAAVSEERRFDDVVMRRVADVVAAAKTDDRAQLERAFRALSPLDSGDVIAELFLRIKEATTGVELDALLSAAELPLPSKSRELVAAVRNNDLGAVSAAIDEKTPERLFATLVVLAASLENARRRL